MNRNDKIKQVLKLRELANSEYALGNNAAGKAAMAKAVALMDSHNITRAELAQAVAPVAPTTSPHAGAASSGAVKTRAVEIKWTGHTVTVNGKTVRTEREAMHVVASDLVADFLKQLFKQ